MLARSDDLYDSWPEEAQASEESAPSETYCDFVSQALDCLSRECCGVDEAADGPSCDELWEEFEAAFEESCG